MKTHPAFDREFVDFEGMNSNNQQAEEIYAKLKNDSSHRSRVIMAGIITENYIDRLLKLFFVNFTELTDIMAFNFSFKIKLIRSLNFIPADILKYCDCIRESRNQFAHNLDIETIDHIKPKTKAQIENLYSSRFQKDDRPLIHKFDAVFFAAKDGIRGYEQNIRLLRKKIDDPNFTSALYLENEKRHHEYREKIMKTKPDSTIIRGDEIEERWGSIARIRKIKKENK